MNLRRRTVAAVATVLLSGGGWAQSYLLGWGENSAGQCNAPPLPAGSSYTHVASALRHAVGILSDGSAVGWGDCAFAVCGSHVAPAGLTYVSADATYHSVLALRSDGGIDGWGWCLYGLCNVPALPPGVAYTQVASNGSNHALALRSDGQIVGWGYESNNFELHVPALPAGLVYVEVETCNDIAAARRSDGSVVGWGNNWGGQNNVPTPPPGRTYVDIAVGYGFTVARLSDGSAVAWGDNAYGQCNVPPLLPGVSYSAIAAGDYHTVALRSDGSVVAWGRNLFGECDVPPLPPGFTCVQVEASNGVSFARLESGSAPTLQCPSDFVEVWNGGIPVGQADPSHTGTATYVDGCPSGVQLGYADISVVPNTPANPGAPEVVITRRWTLTDGCGTSQSCDQVITLLSPSGLDGRFALDVAPGTCPNTFVPAAASTRISLVGTWLHDVSAVAANTLKLRRADHVGRAIKVQTAWIGFADLTSPFYGPPGECGTGGSDGHVDLVIDVPNWALTRAFKLGEVVAGSSVELELTGALLDGTTIAVTDALILNP
jgi:hypothetical protein